ncbi:Dehydrogenases with different specificities (related to short-chain alcohol dehydrogenases) [Ceraceosorus bombacis]|uniref:Dehydrogenases with different specificities (Related to short-chain alcohol dehydrogenases) n=1 Tax=Ceraceosorus bombacis TaxID=401625 RepID=A0A0P1BSQ0_9BASI|nr:Dehydrogenases with different specificities (related to short-chain alcohol dehydrogenases) [Ceraceosorus bombacis]
MAELFDNVKFEKPSGEFGDEVVARLPHRVRAKTFVVTGASPDSLALAAVQSLVKGGAGRIFLLGRSQGKIQAAIDSLGQVDTVLVPIIADLTSIRSVQKGGEEIVAKAQDSGIDYVLASAGIMATPWQLTHDGIESQFGVCHVAHFVLTKVLLQAAQEAHRPAPRFSYASSTGYHGGNFRGDDYNFKQGAEYHPWVAYGQAKSANIILARELARQKAGVMAFSVDPGMVKTRLARSLSKETMIAFGFADENGVPKSTGTSTFGLEFSTHERAAGQMLYSLLDPSLEAQNGAFISNGRVLAVDAAQTEEGLSQKLWQVSEDIVSRALQ